MYAFFREAFRRFYDQATDLGFTIANACYPMSVPAEDPSGLTAVYQATASSSIVDFTRAERAILYQALFDTIPVNKSGVAGASCTKCDWECWRDPSALIELGLLARRPWSFVSTVVSDSDYVKTWLEDLRYIRACGYLTAAPRPTTTACHTSSGRSRRADECARLRNRIAPDCSRMRRCVRACPAAKHSNSHATPPDDAIQLARMLPCEGAWRSPFNEAPSSRSSSSA